MADLMTAGDRAALAATLAAGDGFDGRVAAAWETVTNVCLSIVLAHNEFVAILADNAKVRVTEINASEIVGTRPYAMDAAEMEALLVDALMGELGEVAFAAEHERRFTAALAARNFYFLSLNIAQTAVRTAPAVTVADEFAALVQPEPLDFEQRRALAQRARDCGRAEALIALIEGVMLAVINARGADRTRQVSDFVQSAADSEAYEALLAAKGQAERGFTIANLVPMHRFLSTAEPEPPAVEDIIDGMFAQDFKGITGEPVDVSPLGELGVADWVRLKVIVVRVMAWARRRPGGRPKSDERVDIQAFKALDEWKFLSRAEKRVFEKAESVLVGCTIVQLRTLLGVIRKKIGD
jgi:hypothetical protein